MNERDPRKHPVLRVFAEAAEVIESKAHDYADDSNVFSNFEFVDSVLGGKGLSFLALIATKVARIQQLTLAAKRPMNESLYDSLLDLGNYAFLWAASIPPGPPTTVREAREQATFEQTMANIEQDILRSDTWGDVPPGLSEL